MGKSQTISLENFNPTEFTEKARVVLIRELGLYEMKIVEKYVLFSSQE